MTCWLPGESSNLSQVIMRKGVRSIDVKKLKCVTEFKVNIVRTKRLINSLFGNITTTETFLEYVSKDNKAVMDNPISKSLVIEKRDRDYIFELGYIALFANFEALMHDFIKDLYQNYPRFMLGIERTVKVSEIVVLESGEKIREWIIDELAIENSKSIDDWSQFLEKCFKIKVFPNAEFKNQLNMLNQLRNSYLHSGGITNTRFVRIMQKLLKAKIPLNQSLDFAERERYFKILFSKLNSLVGHLESI